MRMTKAERAAEKTRTEAIYAKNRAIVAVGKCPMCGRELRVNLAITGWYTCVQRGAEGFRADPTQPSCDFQCFTR